MTSRIFRGEACAGAATKRLFEPEASLARLAAYQRAGRAGKGVGQKNLLPFHGQRKEFNQ